MSNALQFFGGGLNDPVFYQQLPPSATITSPVDGYMATMATAGGGSGAATGNGNTVVATGGGASEIAFDLIKVTAGQTVTITLGGGGGQVTAAAGVNTNGADGNDTTVTSSGYTTLTVKGGKGGIWALNTEGAAAGAGGSCSR